MIGLAYQALYRTYRPSAFEEVSGQKHIVKTLENAVKQNKIGHAYLFCGPRGTGKTTIARLLAKAVNCEGENPPCNECESCLAIQNGSHPDVIEIDAASNNGVDDVRDLIEKVKFAPTMGKYKIYIIDEVHMMSTSGFNALLKTLEEPPDYVIFILATTDPQKVLPTIISRCQRFDFGKISQEDIIGRIRDVLSKENIESDEESIQLIASLADGGMRDALSILDQCIAFSPDKLDVNVINEIYGITTVDEKINLLRYVKDKDTINLLQLYRKYVTQGIDIKRFSNDLIDLLKETIIYKRTNGEGYSFINPKDKLSIIANDFDEKTCFRLISLLLETNEKLRFASNASAYFELCLLQMTNDETEQVVVKEVVRETAIPAAAPLVSTKTEIKKAKFEALDMEFVLGLLVQGKKSEREVISNAFKKLSDYYLDDAYRTAAKWLANASIVACDADSFILVSCGYATEANLINDESHKEAIVRLMKKMLGSERMVFAISDEYRNRIIAEFKTRSSNGSLPSPVKIEVLRIEEETVKDNSMEVEEKLKAICGELLEIEEE